MERDPVKGKALTMSANHDEEPKPFLSRLGPMPIDYINQGAVRKLALRIASENRHRKFTRVSRRFLLEIDAAVLRLVAEKVHGSPSKGKTL
jgi:hypothetical protein